MRIDLGTETVEQEKDSRYIQGGCLMPYRLCALTSAQLKPSSVRFCNNRFVEYAPSSESGEWPWLQRVAPVYPKVYPKIL